MAFSSGSRGLLATAGTWVAVFGIGAVTVVYNEPLRRMVAAPLIEVIVQGGAPADGQRGEASGEAKQAAGLGEAPRAERSVRIRTSDNGHFAATFHINGRPVDAMVDTGATMIALTFEDARAAGIHPSQADFRHAVSTANGTARVAAVTLESVAIDDIVVHDVRAVVAEPGRLNTTLLGMSFLGRLSGYEVRGGVLTLQQ